MEDRTHKTMSPGKMDGQTWQIALRRDKVGSGRGAIKARRWRRGGGDVCESAKKRGRKEGMRRTQKVTKEPPQGQKTRADPTQQISSDKD